MSNMADTVTALLQTEGRLWTLTWNFRVSNLNLAEPQPRVLAPSLERWQGEVEAQRALDSARLLWARFVARNRSDLVRLETLLRRAAAEASHACSTSHAS